MSPELHADPVSREQLIVKYLSRKLDEDEAAEFESHYLSCRECYEEVRATELLIYGLSQIVVDRTYASEIAVIRFSRLAELTNTSSDLTALVETIRSETDRKVLIDLSNVSRIDSTGLGMLINCYCHAVQNRGVLKLLNPNEQIRKVLNITKIDSLLHTVESEDAGIRSLHSE